MILDTNAISALADNNPALAQELATTSTAALPFIAYAEFRYGLHGSNRPEVGLQLLANLTEKLPLLFPSPETLEAYALLKDDLKRNGLKIPDNDLWIAALARQHDMPVLSQDRHFDDVPDIRRIGW